LEARVDELTISWVHQPRQVLSGGQLRGTLRLYNRSHQTVLGHRAEAQLLRPDHTPIHQLVTTTLALFVAPIPPSGHHDFDWLLQAVQQQPPGLDLQATPLPPGRYVVTASVVVNHDQRVNANPLDIMVVPPPTG
jgi:hypothetical protein